MPRTTLSQTVLAEPESGTQHTAVTYTAADVSNGNRYTMNGNQILLARNSGASTRNITITSGLLKGRSKTLASIPITAGQELAFPRHAIEGWKQTDGFFYVSADNAEVLFAVLNLQNQPNA